MAIEQNKLKNIIEAALLAVAKPMSVEQLNKLFAEDEQPTNGDIRDALVVLQAESEGRGVELKEVASGYRYQARSEYSEWLSRLWEERPAKYSRASLETLALIAYRQPVTRAEIEDVRGVGVSSSIIKTMIEREWIRVVGHRDVPGRPALYATTKQFLDYFNMKSLEELPSLAEIKDLDELHPELDLPNPDDERESQGGKQAEGADSDSEDPFVETLDESSTDTDLDTESVMQAEDEFEGEPKTDTAETDTERETEIEIEAETLIETEQVLVEVSVEEQVVTDINVDEPLQSEDEESIEPTDNEPQR